MSELKIIGNPIVLRSQIDSKKRTTQKFRKFMKIVDIVPVKFNLDFSQLATDTQGNAVNLNFNDAIKDFKDKQAAYGLSNTDISGLRLLLTADTVAQEDVTNNFQENKIESLINSLGGYSPAFRDLIKSVGGISGIQKTAEEVLPSVSEKLGFNKKQTEEFLGTASGAVSESTNNSGGAFLQAGKRLVRGLTDLVVQGRHASLPKIWQQSTYNPSLSLAVRLVSPYGTQTSIEKFIVEPLVYLLLLASPNSRDGLTYGNPPYVHIQAYGITNINLGYIESVSFRRGGDEVTYNKHKQPLFLDISLSIRPAMTGFAALLDTQNNRTPRDIQFSDVRKTALDIITAGTGGRPGITTVGNIINSFRQAPESTSDVARTSLQNRPFQKTQTVNAFTEQVGNAVKKTSSSIVGG